MGFHINLDASSLRHLSEARSPSSATIASSPGRPMSGAMWQEDDDEEEKGATNVFSVMVNGLLPFDKNNMILNARSAAVIICILDEDKSTSSLNQMTMLSVPGALLTLKGTM